MSATRSTWAAVGATSLFVVLWSSGAIFARVALDHASAFALLALRFAIAFLLLTALALSRRPRVLPARGSRARVATAGVLLLGAYSACYFLALDHGVAPGVLATVLGAQPLLTLVLTERRWSWRRALGLALAMAGLALVVLHGAVVAQLPALGMGFALGALAGMTAGAILQKAVAQPPLAVLPLQYAASLALVLLLAPLQPWHVAATPGFVVALLWLAIVISVVAQLLLYRLIRAGNLVDVTSMFYLVPIVTVAMDRWVLGTPVSALSVAGSACILAGLALAMARRARPARGVSS